MHSLDFQVSNRRPLKLNSICVDHFLLSKNSPFLFTSNENDNPPLVKEELTKKNEDMDILERISHIGTDEIGITDYFGPICVVSCFIDKDDFKWLDQLDLSNVKSLTQSEIIELAKIIKEKVIYSLLILDNPHYNKMVADGLNPASIKAKLFNQAITNVMHKIKKPIQMKVAELFVSKKTYYNYLKKEVIVVKDVEFDSNAHSKYLAVACAHILSRYASIQYFNNMTTKLRIKLPRGTNILVDKIGTQLVSTYGDAILNKVAKKHFANTRKILELKNKEANN